MATTKQVIAVFDIGKTHKKFLIFDENYTVVECHQTELSQTLDDDGDPCEDLEELEFWVIDHFSRAKKNYEIIALNFSAYGASLVHIDQNGTPVTPLYNYLKEYPDPLLNQFYKFTGSKEIFSLETASTPMGMLNSGLQLYWLKYKKPDLFAKIETSLHLPNYLSYLFSGKKVSELTSIGCHTALWDFAKSGYHQWVSDEGLVRLLPDPHSAYTSFENTVNNSIRPARNPSKQAGSDSSQPASNPSQQVGSESPLVDRNPSQQAGRDVLNAVGHLKVGAGIHDSSAALTPYLLGLDEPFLLISTGTWSISLNPFNSEPLTYHELEKDCLCYMDIFGNQVKASRFFLGAEYAHQKKKIERHFGTYIDDNRMKIDVRLIRQLIKKKNSEYLLKLEKAAHTGPYPHAVQGDWNVTLFSSAEQAYHQLMLDLVAIQADSIRLILGSGNIEQFIATGGFSKSNFFISLLASFFPDKQLYTSKLSDASALGAAMVLNEKIEDVNGGNPPFSDFDDSGVFAFSQRHNDLAKLLSLKKAKPIEGLQLMNYSWV